jgi:hypothetical protein
MRIIRVAWVHGVAVLLVVAVMGITAPASANAAGSGTIAPPTGVSATCKGLSWMVYSHDPKRDLVLVGADFHSNPYVGDTDCGTALPIVCLHPQNLPLPEDITTDYYHGWSGGRVALSPPVRGTSLTSRAAANAECARQFGAGFRMGEHHDGGGGWSWYARGDGQRMWIASNTTSSPWSSTTGKAVTWTVRGKRWSNDLTTFGADYRTNLSRGDTAVAELLPVLCLKGSYPTLQASLTRPVAGTTLTSRKAADTFCGRQKGWGWRMGGVHRTSWQATADSPRMWVAIDDQPGNPWDYLG